MGHYVDIIRSPHFNRFAALIRVPTWGYWWKQHHADVPFWMLLKGVTDLTSDEQFAQDKTPWLAAFVRLVTAITQADERLFYTEEDMDWLAGVLDGPDALVTASLLLAFGTAPDQYVTPVEVAMATDSAESSWRNKAAAGDIPGALKKGKQWLLPLSGLRAIGVAPDALLRAHEEQGQELEGTIR